MMGPGSEKVNCERVQPRRLPARQFPGKASSEAVHMGPNMRASNARMLGESADLAQWAALGIGALRVLHVVRGNQWREAQSALGAAATVLFILSKV